MKKAQVSIEMMFSIGIMILIFLGLFYFTFERRIELQKTETLIDDKIECNKISNMITMAYVTQSNHTLIIENNLTVSSQAKVIYSGTNDYPCPVPISRISNSSGNYIQLEKGTITVNYLKTEDLVEVKNA